MMGVPEPAATLAWARSREAGAELFHGKFLHTPGWRCNKNHDDDPRYHVFRGCLVPRYRSRRFGCCQRVVKIVIPHPKWIFRFFLRKKLDSNIHSHEARRSKLFTR